MRYKQKLREVWLQMPEFKAWLRRDPEDSYRALCRFCKCGVNTKICDLRAHALTKKHERMKPALEFRRSLSSNEDDFNGFRDQPIPKTPKPKRPKKIKAEKKTNIKVENTSNNNVDYEAIIGGLALYEPEQILFSNGSTTHSGDQAVKPETPIMDEEVISNAVTAAVKNLKDSAQIFGDFVADRLRKLSERTSELTKDKVMQVLLEAASLDRSMIIELNE